jgi:preprotein translocase subunit SecB
MEKNNQLESGFKILNLLLMENNFKREAVVTFDQSKTTSSVNVDVNVQVKDKTVFVTETLSFTQKREEQIEVSANIKMVGIFEKIGDTSLNLEEFGKVNGAAIIFPYIREQLTNLSAKAGIGLIILPPFNFTRKAPEPQSFPQNHPAE